MPNSKSSADRPRAQAANARRVAANKEVAAKAAILARAKLLEPGTSSHIKAPKGGVKSMSAEDRSARNKVNRLYKKLGPALVRADKQPHPEHLKTHTKTVTKEQAKKLKARGQVVVKVGDNYRALYGANTTITKAGEVKTKVNGKVIRSAKLNARNLLDGSLNAYIEEEFRKAAGKYELGFMFSVNGDRVVNIIPFHSAQAMIAYLEKYQDKIMEDVLGELVIIPLPEQTMLAKKYHFQRGEQRSKRRSKYKPVDTLQERQKEYRREENRKRQTKSRAAKKNK